MGVAVIKAKSRSKLADLRARSKSCSYVQFDFFYFLLSALDILVSQLKGGLYAYRLIV